MGKIPVGETISGAYGFAFAGFLEVLGIAWLPHVVEVAFIAAVVYGLTPDLPGRLMHGQFDMVTLLEYGRISGLIWLAGIITQAMVTVGLQKKALGEMPGPTFFYFSFGAPIWRMIGAVILAFVAALILLAVTAGVTALVSVLAVKYVAHFGYAIMVIAIIAAVCWYIYALVRIFFFLPAVVVAEESIGLPRAWELAAGNFWRIIAVLFVVFVPVLIGFGIVERALIGPFIPMSVIEHLKEFHPDMTPDQVGQFYQTVFRDIFAQMRATLPLLVLIIVIRSIVFLGLGNGAVAKAYLGVTGKDAA